MSGGLKLRWNDWSASAAKTSNIYSSAVHIVTAPLLVQKLWNYCHILRDDGLSDGDYVGQLTYLLFLKMADE